MQIVRENATNEALTIALQGHIDSSNAAEAEAEIARLRGADPNGKLLLNAEELEYISSAGLRIILRLLKKEPGIEMLNVSSGVYEVLETTGFTEMMPVKKAYRRLSIEGCEVVGKGANGVIYRLDPETIVKTYQYADALNEMHQSRELARKAFVLGIPTAIPYDIVRAGEDYGAVFELLSATSISKLIARDPEHIDDYMKIYVDLLKKIHGTAVAPGEMPDMKAIALDWADYLRDHLPEEQWLKLHRLISEVPECHNMLHCDYHSNNIMVQDGEALLIDMDTLAIGHPVFELAFIFNGFVGFPEVEHSIAMSFLGLPYETTQYMWDKTLRLYFDSEDEAYLSAVAEKAMLIGYTRILRRTLRREADTELGKKRIELCKSHIESLLNRVDSLAF